MISPYSRSMKDVLDGQGQEQKGGAFERMKGDDPNWCRGFGLGPVG